MLVLRFLICLWTLDVSLTLFYAPLLFCLFALRDCSHGFPVQGSLRLDDAFVGQSDYARDSTGEHHRALASYQGRVRCYEDAHKIWLAEVFNVQPQRWTVFFGSSKPYKI